MAVTAYQISRKSTHRFRSYWLGTYRHTDTQTHTHTHTHTHTGWRSDKPTLIFFKVG
jgi:hypothetical protein